MPANQIFPLILLSLTLPATAPQAHAGGNVQRGADIFAEECGDCHSTSPGKNKKGPPLASINGRKAGALSDFQGYSEAMKISGLTWSPEKIDAYITQPRKVVPGGKMKYDGLGDPGARSDVIAYLLSGK